ncbi:hypothetical protein BDZ94DRAFT_1245056 [Collybia nuda]|uniref:Peptidase S54 rhomboid domain-containing protein n=1 Tax=Collybia nuda TaxID=64659 RepID=A0A9P5YJY0_9AGAR|nr:hypothetical protein BDZ94DRAFT_1245056 [Collybia nuda]
MSASLIHHAFGRPIFSILRIQPLSRRHISKSKISVRITPSLPLSPILRRPWSHQRFFSSTPLSQGPRSYLSRPPQSNRPRKPQFLAFLDAIPQNQVFYGILAINGLVFAMWYMSTERLKQERNPTSYKWMKDNFTVSWRNISEGRLWTIATSCFSHESISHILFNGFTFFFMARPVLSMIGSRQFIFLYMGGGLAANIASVAWANLVKGRDNGSYGASAAIYSVVSFLACVAPKMTFQLYGIIPVPAWLVVAGIFTYDTYSAINDKRRTTDTAGHVAGLLAGMGYFLGRRFRIF